MKAQRLIFWAVLVIGFFAARYTGLRVLYILVFAQLLLLLLVLIVNFWTVHTFRFNQNTDSSQAVKGSSVKLSVHMTNESFIPLSLMEIRVVLPSPGRSQTVSLCVPPFSETDFTVDMDLPYRGVYDVGMKEIRVTDVFGLTSIRYDMGRLPWYRMCRLMVVPRSPAASSAGEIFDEKLFGDLRVTPASSGDSVASARPYLPGDALKRVNWKVSARYGQLFVKQYDSPARENVVILLDNTASGLRRERGALFRRKEKKEEAAVKLAAEADAVCECAVAVARMSLMRGRVARLYAMGANEKLLSVSASDESRMDALLLWLASLGFEEEGTFSDLLSSFADSGYSLVAISANADDALAEELDRYAAAFDSVSLIAVGNIPEKHGDVSIVPVPEGTDVFALFAEEGRRI